MILCTHRTECSECVQIMFSTLYCVLNPHAPNPGPITQWLDQAGFKASNDLIVVNVGAPSQLKTSIVQAYTEHTVPSSEIYFKKVVYF